MLNDPDIDELSYDNTGGTKTVLDLSQYKQLVIGLCNASKDTIINSNTIPYKMFKTGIYISSRIYDTALHELDVRYISDTSVEVLLSGNNTYYIVYGIK